MSKSMHVDYRLAETYFTITGTQEYETDRFSVATGDPVETSAPSRAVATVAIGVRADASSSEAVTFDGTGSDDSFSVTLTRDGRLGTVSFNAVGSGAKVVSAAATVIAFVGGLAASLLDVGAKGVRRSARPSITGTDEQKGGAPSPEDRAREEWGTKHGAQETHRAEYQALLDKAESSLRAARESVTQASGGKDGVAALARARRIERVVRDCRAEIDRVDALYHAWRATTITTRTETWSFDLAIDDLPPWVSGSGTPAVPAAGTQARAAWDHLGVIVQVEPLGDPFARPETTAPVDDRENRPNPDMAADMGDGDPEGERANTIRWRIPRPARIWIWRKKAEGTAAVDRTMTALIVDARSSEADMPLDHRLFGESSGTLDFGDLGMPTTLTGAEKGALGAFADALGGVPDQLVAGLETAKKADAAFADLRDAPSQRRLAALKRQLDITQAELDAKGLAATADDFAKLKRLEQQVDVATAEGSLAGPTELDRLKQELELAKTRAAIQKVLDGDEEPGDDGPADDGADGSASVAQQLADLTKRVAALEG